jgi:thiol-disulfide isomerase/thioredoxin
LQDQQKKKEQILPALYQIVTFYREDSPFGKALNDEINNLNSPIQYNKSEHTFIDYYVNNYSKFLSETAGVKSPKNDDIINFLNTSNNFLETSSLLRPILISFLSNSNKASLNVETDKLLKTVNIETPRGQTVLSELIDIFDVYSLKDLKTKYLAEAKALKCTINERLSGTIKSNDNTAIGAVIPNYKFLSPLNTKAKSLHEVKADKKVLIFWASTCPHCEKEIGEMMTKYAELKSKNIEVVGFSLDTDKTAYADKVKLLPWINDTELKGWYSSYVETYNIHATPTFYVVDASNKIVATPDNFLEVLNFLGLK